jgi:hypothetical protein
MTLAFNTRHPHVRRDNRWIASLSDGTTVFEDATPGEPAAWKRLRHYVRANSLQITNLRLEVYGQAVTMVSMKDGAEGYWHCNGMGGFIGISEWKSRGVGYVKGDKVYITWLRNDGTVTGEIRDLDPGDIGLTLHEV